MKETKLADTSKPENGIVDMLSSLPDHILVLIISRISINQVVRISILSKRWRYMWKSTPYFPVLDIDSRRLFYDENDRKFTKFVKWGLANKTHDLHTFRVSSYFKCRLDTTVDEWIQAAVERKVKSLDLMIRPRSGILLLPSCMENCDSLESLRLDTNKQSLCLNNIAYLPALRVFELNDVFFYTNAIIESFLKSCPLLEEFSMINCKMMKRHVLPKNVILSSPKLKTLRIHNLILDRCKCSLLISCPKLVVLDYINCLKTRLIFENTHSLKKAVILPNDHNLQFNFSSEYGNTMCKSLAVFSNVESLSLDLYFMQAINAASDPEKNLPSSFPNLKTLELTTKIGASSMNSIIRILKCSPNLESFCLIIQKEFLKPKYWNLEEVEIRSILTRHLKRVEFLDFNGEVPKVDVAHFLLEHGNGLEEMVFSWHDEDKYYENSNETIK